MFNCKKCQKWFRDNCDLKRHQLRIKPCVKKNNDILSEICKKDNLDPKHSLDDKVNLIVNFGKTDKSTKLGELMDELRNIRKKYDTDPKKFFQMLIDLIDKYDKSIEKDK
jgi:hypothetical protein